MFKGVEGKFLPRVFPKMQLYKATSSPTLKELLTSLKQEVTDRVSLKAIQKLASTLVVLLSAHMALPTHFMQMAEEDQQESLQFTVSEATQQSTRVESTVDRKRGKRALGHLPR